MTTNDDFSRGFYLEVWVVVNMVLSLMGNVTLIYFGTATLWARGQSGVNVLAWVYLLGGVLAVDAAYLGCMVALTAAKCRRREKRDGVFKVYRDAWYTSHRRLAAVVFLNSAWAFTAVLMFYEAYGGEDPWQWPSKYNIERWEKVNLWRIIQAVGTVIRLYTTADKYYPAIGRLFRSPFVQEKK